jgi:predicted dithiol-disulfide oxidoreductase (DUF899 family)
VRVEKTYEFDSPQGRVTLADLFRDRSQLFVQHVMQGPNQPLQCVGCALGVDHLEGILPHLENHDVSVVAIARATMPELSALRERMGWRIPFFSSYGSDFNYDYGVSFKPEDIAAGRAFCNFGYGSPGIEDISGNSVFYKDESGAISTPIRTTRAAVRTSSASIASSKSLRRDATNTASRLDDRLGSAAQHVRQGWRSGTERPVHPARVLLHVRRNGSRFTS